MKHSNRLPPSSKFRSGHLPTTAIPVSTRSLSDATDSDDDEDEVYGGRDSLDYIPNSNSRYPNYSSASTYSDVTSSMETAVGRNSNVPSRLPRGSGFSARFGRPGRAGRSACTEDENDEDSNSASSSEFSTTQAASSNGFPLPGSRLRVSEDYASSAASRPNVDTFAAKVAHPLNLPNEKSSFDGDVPSAPPFSGSRPEIKEAVEATSELLKISQTAASSGFSNTVYNTGSKNLDQSGSETSAEQPLSSVPNPARVPTFHASALGPWHAVIAYDGCVRLCLHAWARGCMEAPIFLHGSSKNMFSFFN